LLAAFVLFVVGIHFAMANFAMAEDFSRPVKTYPFGVLNQRSVSLTAQYWNPILRYLSEKTGVPLSLRIARTANETTDLAVKGELAFVYTNHLFTPDRDKLGYTVLARQEGEAIRGTDCSGQKLTYRQPQRIA
jgi:phosphonate transport system substrate-binding protein